MMINSLPNYETLNHELQRLLPIKVYRKHYTDWTFLGQQRLELIRDAIGRYESYPTAASRHTQQWQRVSAMLSDLIGIREDQTTPNSRRVIAQLVDCHLSLISETI